MCSAEPGVAGIGTACTTVQLEQQQPQCTWWLFWPDCATRDACASQFRTCAACSACNYHIWCGSWNDWSGHVQRSPSWASTVSSAAATASAGLRHVHCTFCSPRFHAAHSMGLRPAGVAIKSSMLGVRGPDPACRLAPCHGCRPAPCGSDQTQGQYQGQDRRVP